ncbi:MAG: FAD-dependent oxidoreductase, partial [Acidobacteria bacterium]|nr:FAD-dependent oxidoreductase [Acidobacteriota bacterium]
MQRRHFLPLLCGPLAAAAEKDAPVRYDVVVYGGTAGGLAAAMSAAKEGASVLVLEPSNHVGGMVTGGLGRTDVGIAQSIGGMAAEFYRRVKLHYDKPESWKLGQTREDYLAGQPRCVLDDKWWFHEPSVASAIFSQMLSEQRVQVLRGRSLKRLR